MLAYLATKEQFLNDAPRIESIVRDKVLEKLNVKVSESEYRAWQNSLGKAMFEIMKDSKIPSDVAVAIEYHLGLGKARIDFMLAGKNRDNKPLLIIVELKQWDKIDLSEIRDHVRTFVGGAVRDELHPSYQAWSYRFRLESFNEFIYENAVIIDAFSYLHNCSSKSVVGSSRYEEVLSLSPVYVKSDSEKLKDLLSNQIKAGEGISLLEKVGTSAIKPSPSLAESVGNMLKGMQEFVLLDEQKTVFEKILLAASKSQSGEKQVIIVDGGPGTGKSVISINALAALTAQRMNVRYVTANGAPRDVFKAKVGNGVTREAFKELFSGSAAFHSYQEDHFDVLLVDEAHRLKLKSIYEKNGKNQIMEIIKVAKTAVFFIDEAQKVTWADIGEKEEIKKFAAEFGAEIHEMQLTSQFRCGGSDNYLEWIEQILGIKPNDGQLFSLRSFDFKVFDNPTDLHQQIFKLNKINNKSRVVAGYCWDWVSKSDFKKSDIIIGEYKAKWNLAKYNDSWIINPNSVSEVGCIHTCQGLEVDYIGVIIGDDLKYRNGNFVTNPEARAKTDKSLNGFRKARVLDEQGALRKADEIIRNTYRTLLTRGMKGCYIYSTDPETSMFFQNAMRDIQALSRVR